MNPNPPDMSQAATQWAQMWQDMMQTWLSYMFPFAPGYRFPFGPGNGWSPFDGFGPSRTGKSSDVSVDVETSQRVSVSLRLVSSSNGPLKARLHREDGDGALALEFTTSSLRIKVPQDQAPGVYSGVVRDGIGNQCGMLTVTVFAPVR